jgi:hypothetical protein
VILMSLAHVFFCAGWMCNPSVSLTQSRWFKNEKGRGDLLLIIDWVS